MMARILGIWGGVGMALCVAFSPAIAQTSDDTTIVPHFTYEEIESVLSSLHLPHLRVKDQAGNLYLSVSDPESGVSFAVTLTVCEGAGCYGLWIDTAYDRGAEIPWQVVNEFDLEQPFVSAGLVDNTTAFVSRYEIADFGIPRGNIRSNFTNFIAIAEMLPDFIEANGTMASATGLSPEFKMLPVADVTERRPPLSHAHGAGSAGGGPETRTLNHF